MILYAIAHARLVCVPAFAYHCLHTAIDSGRRSSYDTIPPHALTAARVSRRRACTSPPQYIVARPPSLSAGVSPTSSAPAQLRHIPRMQTPAAACAPSLPHSPNPKTQERVYQRRSPPPPYNKPAYGHHARLRLMLTSLPACKRSPRTAIFLSLPPCCASSGSTSWHASRRSPLRLSAHQTPRLPV
ncbi:hypothetical protein B0H19DRAFT_1267036 [Mycena capillaripes]|nr:hypothetical protein B0H19DRAFT_1267036 [Mycena capillaripes]